MSDELSQPAEKMNIYHILFEVAIEGLLLKIHMQESLHDKNANNSQSWAHKPDEKVTHQPDYG